MHWWLIYLSIGAGVGFLAGLLGIGGGMTMVPFLVFAFQAQGFPTHQILHLALGTAMAGVVFTSFSSLLAHHRHQAVDWKIVHEITPGIVIGIIISALVAHALSSRELGLFFA